MTRDVHWCVTVDYQQIENDNIANQIHRFTIDYGTFILIRIMRWQDSQSPQTIGGKKQSEAGWSDCLIFSYGNSGFFITEK